tara:strand:- start:7439 stop:8614 length:1176 start_codon:yes stop_codon:yes gene_type:complete
MTYKFEKPILVTKPLMPKKEDIFKLFEEVMDSGWITNMGKQHAIFEKEIAEYLEVSNASVFNNGTLALIVALKSLNLPIGSEVITTPFTFAATAHSIAWNGLIPVFADIEQKTMTLCPKAIEKAITSKTSAVLPVHVYGFPCDVIAIDALAKKYNLRVVYDGAHAFTTKISGKSICEYGNVTMLSFHATKLFNSIEGGALIYKDTALGKKIYELRNFGIKKFENAEDIKEGIKTKDLIYDIGINGKINELQAAWGRAVLGMVEDEQISRQAVAKIYKTELSKIDAITIPEMPRNTKNSMQYFPIIIDPKNGISRDDIYDFLIKNNVHSRKYFFPLCSDFKCYKNYQSANPLNLPVAHKIADNILCLPFYGELSEDKRVEKICDIIKGLLHV